MKTCCFLGHRKINETEELKCRLKSIITYLIEEENVETFLFGSNSNFNDLCHLVVTELKEKYPTLRRICYTCKSEVCTLESERKKYEKTYSSVLKKEIRLLGFEEEVEHKTKFQAGKASYIERNQAMIIDSDFCVFYYDKNYVPLTKTNSGTKIAYEYAKKKRKRTINLFE